jgi:micrococcal nuclease
VQSQEQLTLDPSRPVRCKVLKLYDGDTFGCDINGNGRISRPEEMVRLLGIDSPEMHWSKKNTTGKDLPFAPEAMAYMEQRVMHKMVRLEFDKRRTDRYGRNLAYAYVDEGKASKTSLNEELVRKGLAKLLFLGKNRRYEAQFQQVEEQAKVAKVGIWSLEPAG